MRQKRTKGELYTKCLCAKQRMKMGYWTDIRKLREEDCSKAEEHGKSAQAVTDYYRSKFAREFAITHTTVCEQDESLYLRVCSILDNNEDEINPIGLLIEHDKYDEMDSSAQQRYIVNLASKYQELAIRYKKEKEEKARKLV